MIFEVIDDGFFEFEEELIGVGKMGAFFDHVGGILESLEEELQSFAGVGVLYFVYEDHGEELFGVVEVAEVLVFLDEDLVVKDDFYLIQTLHNVVALLLLERPVCDKTETIF